VGVRVRDEVFDEFPAYVGLSWASESSVNGCPVDEAFQKSKQRF